MKVKKELLGVSGVVRGLRYEAVLDNRVDFTQSLEGIKDYKSTEYGALVQKYTMPCGDLWRQLFVMFGKVLYRYYVRGLGMLCSKDMAMCVCDYVPYMTDGDRFRSHELDVRSKLGESGLDLMRKELYELLSGMVLIANGDSMYVGDEIPFALRGMHLKLMLYGLGFFMSYPLKDGEYFSVRFKGLVFSEWLWWVYESVGEPNQKFVNDVMRLFRKDIREGTESKTFRIESGLDGRGNVMLPVSESTPGGVSREEEFRVRLGKLKNMKDWTADDFWNEMTYLYETCRTEGDWKSVKAILEMKARSMGIINGENQGGNTAVVLLTEKAVGALAQLGLSRKVVYEQ